MDSRLRGLILACLALALAACEAGATTDDAAIGADSGASDAAADDGGTAWDAGSDASAPLDGGSAPRVTRVYAGLGNGEVVVYSLAPDTGVLTEESRTATGENPSFISGSPDGAHLYVVHENAREVATLEVTAGTGAVSVVDRDDTDGDGPTHVATSPDGRFVMVANYSAGSTALFPVLADGTLGARIETERPGMRAHQVVFDASSAVAYVPCLGSDLVAQFEVSASGLTPLDPASVSFIGGTGPRHLALSVDERFAYVIHELASAITVHPRSASGVLMPSTQRVSTLPEGDPRGNTTAEILVHPGGQLVLGSNRGEDSIAIFGVQPDGTLRIVGHEPTRGRTPRSMALTPDGALLLVANQGSRDIQVFRVEASTGELTHLAGLDTGASATYVGVFEIRAE